MQGLKTSGRGTQKKIQNLVEEIQSCGLLNITQVTITQKRFFEVKIDESRKIISESCIVDLDDMQA